MGQFYLGLDLGQANDFTCAAILEKVMVPGDALPSGEKVQQIVMRRAQYHLRFLEQPARGTAYPAIAQYVKTLMNTAPLSGQTALVVDGTGVGAAVVDMLREAGLQPVVIMITGGDQVHREGQVYRVPKRDLVGVVQVLLQNGRLIFANELPDLDLLKRELLGFQAKIDPATAHDSYSSWRESLHDDIVLAVAVACWYGECAGNAFLDFLRSRSARAAG